MLIQSIKKNTSIIQLHLLSFCARSFLFFLSFLGLRQAMHHFFSSKTINEKLFMDSDLNALQEFFRAYISPNLHAMGVLENVAVIVGLTVMLFFLLFLALDGYIDAGLISVIESGKKSDFFIGLKKHGFSFLKLRLFNVTLYLVVLCLAIIPFGYIYISVGFYSSISVLILLAIPLMFVFKMFDHGKYIILRDNKDVRIAFLISLKSISNHWKETFSLNIQTLLIFIGGCFLYMNLDNFLTVNTETKLWVMFVLHQLTLFGKQVLRYSYLAAIGNLIKRRTK